MLYLYTATEVFNVRELSFSYFDELSLSESQDSIFELCCKWFDFCYILCGRQMVSGQIASSYRPQSHLELHSTWKALDIAGHKQ